MSAKNYHIFTDATMDLPQELMKELSSITIIPMQITVSNTETGECYDWESNQIQINQSFCHLQRNGFQAKTSQISPAVYTQYFESVLKQGSDVLYLGFSSGLSGSFQSALLSAEQLRLRYPERTILCVDSLCASVGLGFLVLEATRLQKSGVSIEELAQWAEAYRMNINHWFTIDTFEYLRRGGRISASSATLGSVLNIKPILNIDCDGILQTDEKARGRRKALSVLMNQLNKRWLPKTSSQIIIGHGDCIEDAENLKSLILNHYPNAEIYLSEIGPVIGAHTGPGVLALIFYGISR